MSRTFEITHSFQAMDSEITAAVSLFEDSREAVEQILKRAEIMFRLIERTISLSDEGSELSVLNASAGRAFKTTPLLYGIIESALQAARLTNGIFDPTAPAHSLPVRSNRSLLPASCPTRPWPSEAPPAWQDIRLNPTRWTVSLPGSCRLDLGGIGKGWALDQISRTLQTAAGYFLEAGNNIRMGGICPTRISRYLRIDGSYSRESRLPSLEIADGAISTAQVHPPRRRTAGRPQNLLIDPRTGQPADTGVVSATVIAETSVEAETLAQAALRLGPQAGLEMINGRCGASGRLVLKDGRVLTSPHFPETICIS